MSRHQPSRAAKTAYEQRWLDAGNTRRSLRLSHEASVALELLAARHALSQNEMIERLILGSALPSGLEVEERIAACMRKYMLSHEEAEHFLAMEAVDTNEGRH